MSLYPVAQFIELYSLPMVCNTTSYEKRSSLRAQYTILNVASCLSVVLELEVIGSMRKT